jgi:asparagine synthetase B (glutamine-hydrolysing)
MCSLLFSTKLPNNPNDIEDINFYLKFRGPDYTSCVGINGHLYIHNLLSITGTFTPQPLTEDNIAVLFNGEIYNFKELINDIDNDTKCIIPLYKKYGPGFTKYLDGEFAIVVVDYNKKIVIISSDIFKTKPLFYSLNGTEIGASSYKTPLEKCGHKNIQKANPNETIVVSLETGHVLERNSIYSFDLTQHKTTYDDWTTAFENSVRKRTSSNREKMFIGISSGYDSGAIACEMAKQKMFFKGYTHIGREDNNILQMRKHMLSKYCVNEQYITTPQEWESAHTFIEKNTEPFMYTIHSSRSNYNEFNLKLIDDNGSNQFSNLCSKAKRDGYKIHLSGMGGDEIFSDYGFGGHSKYQHSNFGGKFPNDLNTIFPWNSFYGSTMESYLAKEEYVGGSYGLESRYPFLDKQVVQEFLWLHVNLKNNNYKNVLHNYLTINSFPFAQGQKVGF